jgi:hypothetical protein
MFEERKKLKLVLGSRCSKSWEGTKSRYRWGQILFNVTTPNLWETERWAKTNGPDGNTGSHKACQNLSMCVCLPTWLLASFSQHIQFPSTYFTLCSQLTNSSTSNFSAEFRIPCEILLQFPSRFSNTPSCLHNYPYQHPSTNCSVLQISYFPQDEDGNSGVFHAVTCWNIRLTLCIERKYVWNKIIREIKRFLALMLPPGFLMVAQTAIVDRFSMWSVTQQEGTNYGNC